MIVSILSLFALVLGDTLSPKESERALQLYREAFVDKNGVPHDQRRIDSFTSEERALLIRWFHASLNTSRAHGTREIDLVTSPTSTCLARLDDDWGLRAVAGEFRRAPRSNWDNTFYLVRNARIIPQIGDLLFKEDEYYKADDVGVTPAQWASARGVIGTLKYAPQFLPDIGIWGKQLEDAWSAPGVDVIGILREWYKENERKLREGKFQEIRPGRVPIVKAADRSEAVKEPTESAAKPSQKAPPSGVTAVAETPGTPEWALWASGILAALLALGIAVHRYRQHSGDP